jgi:hypothetical protein
MNKRECYNIGIGTGHAAVKWMDAPTWGMEHDGQPIDNVECMLDALAFCAFDSELGSRDYSPFEFFAHDLNSCGARSEGLWQSYEDGVARGIKQAIAQLYPIAKLEVELAEWEAEQ